jgi:hypothetical protein
LYYLVLANVYLLRFSYYSKIDAKKQPNGEKKEPEEWGEFLHQPGVKYTDFNLIREEIVRDTELKTGKNAGKHTASVVCLRQWCWRSVCG